MYDQQDGQKMKEQIMEAIDHATKLRASIGYLADTAQEEQLSAVLWTIEGSAEILENILKMLKEGYSRNQVAEDVPFE